MRRRIKPETRRIALSPHTLRRILSWKFVFYDLILPVLRRLGPARGDAVLGFLGWLAMVLRPPRLLRMRGGPRASEHGARRRLADRDDLARPWRPTRRGSSHAITCSTARPTRRS